MLYLDDVIGATASFNSKLIRLRNSVKANAMDAFAILGYHRGWGPVISPSHGCKGAQEKYEKQSHVNNDVAGQEILTVSHISYTP